MSHDPDRADFTLRRLRSAIRSGADVVLIVDEDDEVAVLPLTRSRDHTHTLLGTALEGFELLLTEERASEAEAEAALPRFHRRAVH